MKKTFTFAALALVVSASTSFADPYDEATTNALKACHDYVWLETPDFKDLPNAAVSVFPGIVDDNGVTVFWNVMWDEPTVRAAGNCFAVDGKVEGFEDYTKME